MKTLLPPVDYRESRYSNYFWGEFLLADLKDSLNAISHRSLRAYLNTNQSLWADQGVLYEEIETDTKDIRFVLRTERDLPETQTTLLDIISTLQQKYYCTCGKKHISEPWEDTFLIETPTFSNSHGDQRRLLQMEQANLEEGQEALGFAKAQKVFLEAQRENPTFKEIPENEARLAVLLWSLSQEIQQLTSSEIGLPFTKGTHEATTILRGARTAIGGGPSIASMPSEPPLELSLHFRHLVQPLLAEVSFGQIVVGQLPKLVWDAIRQQIQEQAEFKFQAEKDICLGQEAQALEARKKKVQKKEADIYIRETLIEERERVIAEQTEELKGLMKALRSLSDAKMAHNVAKLKQIQTAERQAAHRLARSEASKRDLAPPEDAPLPPDLEKHFLETTIPHLKSIEELAHEYRLQAPSIIEEQLQVKWGGKNVTPQSQFKTHLDQIHVQKIEQDTIQEIRANIIIKLPYHVPSQIFQLFPDTPRISAKKSNTVVFKQVPLSGDPMDFEGDFNRALKRLDYYRTFDLDSDFQDFFTISSEEEYIRANVSTDLLKGINAPICIGRMIRETFSEGLMNAKGSYCYDAKDVSDFEAFLQQMSSLLKIMKSATPDLLKLQKRIGDSALATRLESIKDMAEFQEFCRNIDHEFLMMDFSSHTKAINQIFINNRHKREIHIQSQTVSFDYILKTDWNYKNIENDLSKKSINIVSVNKDDDGDITGLVIAASCLRKLYSKMGADNIYQCVSIKGSQFTIQTPDGIHVKVSENPKFGFYHLAFDFSETTIVDVRQQRTKKAKISKYIGSQIS